MPAYEFLSALGLDFGQIRDFFATHDWEARWWTNSKYMADALTVALSTNKDLILTIDEYSSAL